MKNIQYQVMKKVRNKTDPKNIILEKYYNYLDIFLKKDSNIFFSYRKYYYKIYLKEE